MRCASPPRARGSFSSQRISQTAIGAISFLALEAIGGTITLSYGTTNAFFAILVASVAMLLIGLPISRYAIRYGVDIDLLTRGASFGYIGSTITSLIYASFTFMLFAIEASIMSAALELALRHSALARLYRQRRHGHPAGHAWRQADQPLPAPDPAVLDRPQHPALRLHRLFRTGEHSRSGGPLPASAMPPGRPARSPPSISSSSAPPPR